MEKRLAEPEMTATRQRNYLDKILEKAEKRRSQVIALKSNATIKFKKGEISEADKKKVPDRSDKFRKEINDFIKHYKFKSKSIKGFGIKS